MFSAEERTSCCLTVNKAAPPAEDAADDLGTLTGAATKSDFNHSYSPKQTNAQVNPSAAGCYWIAYRPAL